MRLQAANAPAPSRTFNRNTLFYLGIVLVAGAIGGLLYWIIAKWTGTQLPTVFGGATVLVLMFMGALAAGVGVYVLTASDVTAIRTYIFAVLCGIAWQPVLAAGTRIASNASASSQNAQLNQQVQQVQSATQTGNTEQVSNAVQQTVPVINKGLELSTSVADSSKKTEILDSSKLAITQLQQSAVKAPDASVDGIKNVTVTASNAGAPTVAIHGIESLNVIGKEAFARHDIVLQKRVQQSLLTIAAQSKDPSVQSAAKAAAAQVQ